MTGEIGMVKGFTIISDGDASSFRARAVADAVAGFKIEDCALSNANSAAASSCLAMTNAAATVTLDRSTVTGKAGDDAVSMVGGSLTISLATIVQGDINLATSACTLAMDFCQWQGAGDIDTTGAVAHSITMRYCDMGGRSIDSAGTGAVAITVKHCANIDNLATADVGGSVQLENSVVTDADKNGTGNWTIYESRISDLANNGGVGTVAIYGGHITTVTAHTSPIVWHNTSEGSFRVINGMSIQHAIDSASANEMIEVESGTYGEALTFDSASDVVNLKGAGIDKTIITQVGSDVVTVLSCGTVCIEDLTLQGTAMDNDNIVKVNAATLPTSLALRRVKVTGARTANNAYGIYTQGGNNVDLVTEDCEVVMTGAGTTYGIYPATSGGTNTATIRRCHVSAPTDDLNVANDCTVNSYFSTYATGGITVASDANCLLYCHNDSILGPIIKGASGVMTYQESVDTYCVFEGMEIMDTADAGSAGDLVLIGPGTFTEALDLDTAVNAKAYKGLNRDKTIITATGDTVFVDGAAGPIGEVIFEDVTINATAATDAQYAVGTSGASNNVALTLRNAIVNTTRSAGVVHGVRVADNGVQTATVAIYDSEITATGVATAYAISTSSANGGSTVDIYRTELNGQTYDIYNAQCTVTTHECKRSGGGVYLANSALAKHLAFNDRVAANVSPVTFAGTAGEYADLSEAVLYTCLATVLRGELVYLSAADTVAEATNLRTAALPARAIVVYKTSAAATQCYVKSHGMMYLADPTTDTGIAFVASQTNWLGVAGASINARPTDALKQKIGACKSTKSMLIQIENIQVIDDHISIPLAWGAGTSAIATHTDGNSRRAGMLVNAAGQAVWSQAIQIPENFLTAPDLHALLLPSTTGTIDWTAYASIAANGQDEATHSGTATADGQAATDDQLLALRLSTAASGLETALDNAAEGDYLNAEFIVDVLTTTTNIMALELKLTYTGQR